MVGRDPQFVDPLPVLRPRQLPGELRASGTPSAALPRQHSPPNVRARGEQLLPLALVPIGIPPRLCLRRRAQPRAASATPSAARSSGGVPDVAYLMRARRRPRPVFLLPRDSALRAPPSASRSSRAAGRPISLHRNTALPRRSSIGKFILPLLWLLPAGRFPCLARFRGATLPGLLGPLQASPRGGMTRRIGRTNGESGNTISRPRRRLYEWLATSHGSGRGKL